MVYGGQWGQIARAITDLAGLSMTEFRWGLLCSEAVHTSQRIGKNRPLGPPGLNRLNYDADDRVNSPTRGYQRTNMIELGRSIFQDDLALEVSLSDFEDDIIRLPKFRLQACTFIKDEMA